MNVENVGELRKWLADNPGRNELLRVAKGFGWEGRKGAAPQLRSYIESRVAGMEDSVALATAIAEVLARIDSEPAVESVPKAEKPKPARKAKAVVPAEPASPLAKKITFEVVEEDIAPARRLILRIGDLEVTGSPKHKSKGPSFRERLSRALGHLGDAVDEMTK